MGWAHEVLLRPRRARWPELSFQGDERQWTGLYGDIPREDSSSADLYKYLIRELSTGGVIRQERDINSVGQFVRRRPRNVRRGAAPTTMESAFEDTKPYVLTALGREFVHYTMNELVRRISSEADRPAL
jgi:hypothetical protein